MPDYTDRFRLSKLGLGDSMSDDGFKFSNDDIDLIDRLLEIATELHVHDGSAASGAEPASGPTLLVTQSGGALPAGTRWYYRFTYVDASGNQSAASAVAYADMPAPIANPTVPTLSSVTTGGTLDPGRYAYMLSAYKDASTLETRAGDPAFITLSNISTTNVVTLDLPGLPVGADGFNIYRKAPGSPRYYFLDSTGAATYDDDGSVLADATRTLPTTNTTNSQNAVTISIDTLPADHTWKIYRTSNPSDWSNSLLKHVVEELGATPTVVQEYDDLGESTFLGSPPDASQMVGGAPKIQLTDAAHVTGQLPPGLNTVPYLAVLRFPGVVTAGVQDVQWVCPFDQARIQHVRAYLDWGTSPAVDDVIVDLDRFVFLSSTQATIFTDPGDRPTIPVGETVGATTVPDVIDLVAQDRLIVSVDQAGGGATPTDEGLVVAVLMLVRHGDETTSQVWA